MILSYMYKYTVHGFHSTLHLGPSVPCQFELSYLLMAHEFPP